MKVEQVQEVTGYSIVLTVEEARRLYTGLADVAGFVGDRPQHPVRDRLYDLFDALYNAGAAD